MIQAKTESGFVIGLDEHAMDNAELLDALCDLQSEDILALGRVVQLLLGKDGKRKLYDHLRSADGRVPVQAVSEAIRDLMASISAGKNSSSSPS